MPVTARLSRRFYDAIGDDAANDLVNWMNAVDLTYRNELLQHNEANFTRFVVLLDARIAALRDEIDRRFQPRFDSIDHRFDAVDQRFDAVDQRFDAVDQRFDAVDQRFDAVDQRFDAVDQRFDAVDQRFAKIDVRLDRVELRLDKIEARLSALELGLDARFAKFEAKLMRWMLVFWTTTMLGVAATVFAVLKAM